VKIAFLFGAGVSQCSGLYGTQKLTEKILAGENVHRGMAENYFVNDMLSNPMPEEDDVYVSRIKKLFHVLTNNLGSHYSFINRMINYEDYYYMIDSMHTDEDMEFENPVVTYFSDYLFKNHTSLFEPFKENFSPLRLVDLMWEAKLYIEYIVASYLDKKPKDLSQFSLLEELYQDNSFSKAYIFTVNHDTLIEQYFKSKEIDFSDGFITKDDTVRDWDSGSFKEKMNLFKLHGSIDWAYYDTDDPYEKNICIYTKQQRGFSPPVIIIGSFNKLRKYSRGISFDLQYLFAKYLTECNRLVISGYSFGDQGINSRIIDWLYDSRDRKIMIIHKEADEMLKNARPAIKSIYHWDVKEKSDLIRIIPKWFQDIDWKGIKDRLN
jgi:hypothetical protein